MKLITWNVAGFRRSNSLNTWDYSEVDVDYFAAQINQIRPDVVVLQEVEFIDQVKDSVETLKEMLGLAFSYKLPMHPNHIGEGLLGYAVLSREKIENTQFSEQQYPSFELSFPDGRSAVRFNKMFLKFCTFGLSFLTFQLQPLHYWGYNYYEEPGYTYSQSLESEILNYDCDVIAGDFQFSHIETPLKKVSNLYYDALPNLFTRKRENGKHTRSDHILTRKSNMKILSSKVVSTSTDHFLCSADIALK